MHQGVTLVFVRRAPLTQYSRNLFISCVSRFGSLISFTLFCLVFVKKTAHMWIFLLYSETTLLASTGKATDQNHVVFIAAIISRYSLIQIMFVMLVK